MTFLWALKSNITQNVYHVSLLWDTLLHDKVVLFVVLPLSLQVAKLHARRENSINNDSYSRRFTQNPPECMYRCSLVVPLLAHTLHLYPEFLG